MPTFRHDIQALRAVAVLLVLAFHVWPAYMRGGYIGVDVFFVISGYLITGHLVREIASTGRVDLPRFYARRARRLLPAASLTLFLVAIASVLCMPSWTWASTATDIAASAGYAENWMLVRRAVDYHAQNEAPSPLQHFWSLAVEEQFYFGWPLMMVAVACLRRRYLNSAKGAPSSMPSTLVLPSTAPFFSDGVVRPLPPHPAWYAVPMAILCAASLVVALLYSQFWPETGYFATHVRLYELGMGGLLAALAPDGLRSQNAPGGGLRHYMSSTLSQSRLRTAVAAGGLAAIGASATLFTQRTVFPGLAALVPTLGTVVTLWAGDDETNEGSSNAKVHALISTLSHPWLQYIGDISYSLYLAHWPVVVMYPFATGRAVDGAVADGVFVCIISFALAHACKRCWEDRFRQVGGSADGGGKPDHGLAPANGIHGASGGLATQYTFKTTSLYYGVSADVGALAMTVLMATVTLSVSFALYKAAPSSAWAIDALQPTTSVVNTSTAEAPWSHATAPVDVHLPRRSLPPSPECNNFFGPNATRPFPGADASLYRCAPLNDKSVDELLSAAARTGEDGRIDDTHYYPNALAVTLATPPPPSNRHHIVIIGDSHGGRWHHAFRIVGQRLGVQVTNLQKTSCPPTLTLVMLRKAQPNVACQKWNLASIEKVLHMRPSAVVMVGYKHRRPADEGANATDIARGIVQMAEKFVSADIPVLYIKSTPDMGTHVLNCLAQVTHRQADGKDMSACSVPRQKGLSDGIMEIAASIYPMMHRMSFDDIFCPGNTCPPIIGNVVVYTDAHHIGKAFSQSLAGALEQQLLQQAPHVLPRS